MKNKISVISLISYDSHLLPKSIESYYSYVDEIILGLDEDRISWSKNPFTFNEGKLWQELKRIDVDDKINVVEGNFHSSDVPIENDNYERNYLKGQCSHEWVMSVDADEVLVNPREFFVEYLPIAGPYLEKADLLFTWYLLYKEFENEYLIIANNDDTFFRGDTQGFMTHRDRTFTYCRWTDSPRRINSPLGILHWSFCRSEEEIDKKISNYGHSNVKDDDPFYRIWKQINLDNYTQLRNFKTHKFSEAQWEKLMIVPKDNLMRMAKENTKMIKL